MVQERKRITLAAAITVAAIAVVALTDAVSILGVMFGVGLLVLSLRLLSRS